MKKLMVLILVVSGILAAAAFARQGEAESNGTYTLKADTACTQVQGEQLACQQECKGKGQGKGDCERKRDGSCDGSGSEKKQGGGERKRDGSCQQ